MFAMQQHQYAYAAVPVPSRQYSGHGTSSAFSSSANPDEDWTKISDLAERRRIQNRIAQRNYRKKLKKRLEDLERRAGTSDGGSSPPASEKASTPSTSRATKKTPTPKKQQQQQQQQQQAQAEAQPQQQPQSLHALPMPPKVMTQGQFTPPLHHDEMIFPQHPVYDEQERTHSPPFLNYSAYPPPDDIMLGGYSQPQAYRPLPAEAYPHYFEPQAVPVTLPPMTHFSDAMKRESAGFGPDDSMSPYMHYGYVPGMEMGAAPTPYDNSNPHTPPLSHSFDQSTNCSDSGYEYPTTPLSMPPSPHHHHSPQH